MNLSMTEDDVRRHCDTQKVAISALERLPGGGTRLVCSSSHDAARTRTSLKKSIIEDDARRTALRPRTPLW